MNSETGPQTGTERPVDDREGSRESRVTEAFVSLSHELVDDYDVIDMLTTLTTSCTDLLDVTSAGLLLADQDGVLHLVASSSERTRHLEVFQLQRDEGPCLDAFHGGEVVSAAGLPEMQQRWPEFAKAAEVVGYESVHALPLRLRDHALGAIGLFSEGAGRLDDADAALARALVHVACVAIVNEKSASDRTVVNRQLQHALDSRVVLEQAKGVLASSGKLEMEDAVQVLRRYARDHGRRLSDVAADVVHRRIESDVLTGPGPDDLPVAGERGGVQSADREVGEQGPESPESVSQRMTAAAREMEDQDDPLATVQSAVELLVRNVEGCEAASISLVHHARGKRRVETPAASGKQAAFVDQLQEELDEGPALDTLWDDDTVYAPDLPHDSRWPSWGVRLAEETGTRSVMTFRLFTIKNVLGALSMYSTKSDAFDAEDKAEALALAAHIAVAVIAAQKFEQYEAALDSRTVTAQACGIVMERYSMDAARAFALLLRLSSTRNVKLRDLAAELVSTRVLPLPARKGD